MYHRSEIAHVGMYEHDAAEKGIAIDTTSTSFRTWIAAAPTVTPTAS
ncbi:MAG: hypothetical protein R2856_37615 [Caldilineaceae bacterium]